MTSNETSPASTGANELGADARVAVDKAMRRHEREVVQKRHMDKTDSATGHGIEVTPAARIALKNVIVRLGKDAGIVATGGRCVVVGNVILEGGTDE